MQCSVEQMHLEEASGLLLPMIQLIHTQTLLHSCA